MQEQTIYQWETLEYDVRVRSSDWFWAVGIIAGALALASIFLGNILLAVLLVVGAVTLIVHHIQEPKKLDISVTDRGVHVNKEFFPYHTLDSFFIEEEIGPPLLALLSKERMILPHVKIALPDELERKELRDYLLNYVDEEYHPATLSESILHFLGI